MPRWKVDPSRVEVLKERTISNGPVIYWMSRDQRAEDNWALIYAQEMALDRDVPLAVIFSLSPDFLGATLRQYSFMLKGLEETAGSLEDKDIPFVMLPGEPAKEVPKFASKHKVSSIVTDFDPLRIKHAWKTGIMKGIRSSLIEVDAHNIVPCRKVSDKQEWGAYTLRPKINRLLDVYLKKTPPLQTHRKKWKTKTPPFSYADLLKRLEVDRSVHGSDLFAPGTAAGSKALRSFLGRLDSYNGTRNDPNESGQSGLSPYLHFGQISAQRVAVDVMSSAADDDSKASFLEELIIRRELADNFCLHNRLYDSVKCFPSWSDKTLREHLRDRREYLYSVKQLEFSRTHDPLWNAAQAEMVKTGKMHGYLRMYWAKKILEWSRSPKEAMRRAIYLNDRYELDGRDPNGYAGIAWSIGGVHDRAWGTRKIFGMVRYMSLSGCEKKFDVGKYIKTWGY
ncbi:MAG: deoxyribodipyrimidine photo-lyase [Candidatus Omnitrophica bacterium]|nr:deoxyribodipyrimidine photo-lyase [Candidatus Omnitrophota bacterium]